MLNIFERTELLLGAHKLSQLKKARVAVIGLGAVGGYALEGLARAAVGHLCLADCDVVDPSNINRQILALHSTIGQKKADVARGRVLDINPSCRVQAVEIFAHHYSIGKILSFQPDLVIDAIDSLNPKVNVLAELHARGVSVISSMGAALKTDPTRIHFGDLFATRGCPLARVVRQRLRRLGIREGIPCVYSTESTGNESLACPFDGAAGSSTDQGRRRNILGSMPTITGIFGLTIAHYAIETLIGGFNGKDTGIHGTKTQSRKDTKVKPERTPSLERNTL